MPEQQLEARLNLTLLPATLALKGESHEGLCSTPDEKPRICPAEGIAGGSGAKRDWGKTCGDGLAGVSVVVMPCWMTMRFHQSPVTHLAPGTAARTITSLPSGITISGECKA